MSKRINLKRPDVRPLAGLDKATYQSFSLWQVCMRGGGLGRFC
ncbi:hypothetical protein YSA_00630 [Pseudomonas putida ND6]|uniref:Uncharacterized protein n=1 Tax=Pseudomonas putida ND6 TaxID=231023 RepID=I3UNP2_PSEPU|nr:hypothetical protein YSA_00630 [Pseudomonas putida ND6]